MRRKTILLASVAGAMLAAAPAQANGFYFSAFGGANFIQSKDALLTNNNGNTFAARFDPDTGFLIGGAVGIGVDHWLQGLKVELEASYRRNDVGGQWAVTTNDSLLGVGAQAVTSGPISANMSTFALMANAWYEFEIGTRFKPYFGGGVGWARAQLDGAFEFDRVRNAGVNAQVNQFGEFTNERSGFAYQLGAGITSQVMPGVSLGLGYRYFDGPNTEIFFGGKIGQVSAQASSSTIKFDNVNHSVALSLNIDIN